jgi:hypothetical protein
MENNPDKPIWKSFVFFKDQCFFVSTIERDFETIEGLTRGQETLVWKFDWKEQKRVGEIIYYGGYIRDHQAACRCLINWGEIPEEDGERWKRFR